jgi:hypothetical protein
LKFAMVLKMPQSFIGAATAGRGSACIVAPTSTLPLTTKPIVAAEIGSMDVVDGVDGVDGVDVTGTTTRMLYGEARGTP